ncbi:MAG: hypothetical protein QW752_03535 [Thermoplasmata archaeon]
MHPDPSSPHPEYSVYWRYPEHGTTGSFSSPIIDKRFNPLEVKDKELRYLKCRNQHKKMSFRLLAYSMIDRDIAYLSPPEVYKIVKKYDLITPWERQAW